MERQQVCDHEETCGCYGQGYADGRSKALFEVRMMLAEAHHAASCGCEPCKLLREIRAAAEPPRPAFDVRIPL